MADSSAPWKTIGLYVGGALLVFVMVFFGLKFPGWETVNTTEVSPTLGLVQTPGQEARKLHPFVEFLKLIAAAAMAMMVTFVNRRFHGDKPLAKSLEQGQILLCVAGAMMMIIIGNSVARALGIAGAASIIRFRTPVEDPRDTVVLLMLLALGMSVGLGAFAVAGLGMLFLCLFLMVLHYIGESLPRILTLHLGSELGEFPTAFVQGYFREKKIRCDPREIGEGEGKFVVHLPPGSSMEAVNFELLNHPGNFINSVEWSEAPKKRKGED
jgi:hypothetical protein